jgi:hypothetical protein
MGSMSVDLWSETESGADLSRDCFSAPWLPWVNENPVDSSLEQIRQCVNRGTPFGSVEWVARVAVRLGLEASMRPLGRPRKPEVV